MSNGSPVELESAVSAATQIVSKPAATKAIDVALSASPRNLTISKISYVRRLGIFTDLSCSDQVPILRKHNLIYGFNGSGKTTLSRIFSSIQVAQLHPEFPSDCEFEIELSNGEKVRHLTDHEVIRQRLSIFNVDFIENNVRWKEGTAEPIYYIGEDQAEAANELQKLQQDFQTISDKIPTALNAQKTADNAFRTHKRDAARSIEAQIKINRGYTARDLDNDYSQPLGDSATLSGDDLKKFGQIIQLDAPLAQLNEIEFNFNATTDHVSLVKALLNTSIGAKVIASLQKHTVMVKWVKDGANYHQSHNLKECLFCGNEISSARFELLKTAVDDSFDRLASEAADAKRKLELLIDGTRRFNTSIPLSALLSKELQEQYELSLTGLKSALNDGDELLAAAHKSITEKILTPNVAISTDHLKTDQELIEWKQKCERLVSNLNNLIRNHNVSHENFQKEKDWARQKVKAHLLKLNEPSYRQYESEFNAAKAATDELANEQANLKNKVGDLKKKVQSHGPACEVINRRLHQYLGHKEIDIFPAETGYQIHRNGEVISGSISEGEKTAIALTYFLTTIGAGTRRLKDQIVVIDDPISSLDSKSLNYAFSVIKQNLRNAGQLILLTHNMNFMNEAKKWLRPNTVHRQKDPKQITATLLFLDVTQKTSDGRRSCSIKELPEYLREYESEYHYFFHLMQRFRTAPESQNEYLYLLPNVLRKILELFLTFKMPGYEQLGSKLQKLSANTDLIDPNRLAALGRLTDVESHSDNLDDLLSFSSMTVEETRDAADALAELMNKMDEHHYKRMCELCQ